MASFFSAVKSGDGKGDKGQAEEKGHCFGNDSLTHVEPPKTGLALRNDRKKDREKNPDNGLSSTFTSKA